LGFDGLVALKPVNVYYLTNTWPALTNFRYDYAAMATFPRDPEQPDFLVCSSAQSWDLANGERDNPDVIAFNTTAANKAAQSPPVKGNTYAIDPAAQLTAREKGWIKAEESRHADPVNGPAGGLAKALRESGLTRGRLAVDDMRVAYLLQRIGFTEAVCVPAEDVFRRIRMVKTPSELALQRVAGQNNAAAALATIQAIEKGM
jgi:Xaa-Pro aminopeptidase